MSFDDDAFLQPRREPEKSNKTCLIVGLIFGGFGGAFLLCGGCCFFAMNFSFSEMESQATLELENNEVIAEHIGTIDSVDVEFWASQNNARDDSWVFRIEGSKGSGTVAVDGIELGEQFSEIYGGTLELDNGETYDLFPEEGDIMPDGLMFDDVLNGEIEGLLENAMKDVTAADDYWTVEDSKLAKLVNAAIEDNPVIRENIGRIEDIEYDFDRSEGEPGIIYVFHLTGSKGNALLRAECVTIDDETEDVISGELTLDSGDKVQLFPDNPLE